MTRYLLNKPKNLIGLTQAAGVAIYVSTFATIVTNFGSSLEHDVPLLGPIIFLMMFVTSALICGSLILAYPIWLTTQGKIKHAFTIVAWSITWLFVILLLIVAVAVIVSRL